MVQWVPFGDGNVGIEAVIDYLAAHAPEAPINLEVITGRAPKEVSYVDPGSEFWRMYPGMLAVDFTRFTTLASRQQLERSVRALKSLPAMGAVVERVHDVDRTEPA